MPTILDRYLVAFFARHFVLGLIILAGVVVLLDVFPKLDSLIEVGRETGSVWQTAGAYCFFRVLPMGLSMLAPIALASAMMTVATMIWLNELVPLQAAGISDARLVTPLFIAVVVVAVGGVAMREAVLPSVMDRLVDHPSAFMPTRGLPMMSKVDNQTGVMIQGDRVFPNSREIHNATFTLRAPLVRRVMLLESKKAVYRDSTQEHPAGFLLQGVADLGDIAQQSLMLGGQPVVLSPHDHSWLASDECFVATRVPFMYIAINDAWRQYASTLEMISAVRNPSLEIGTSQYGTIHGRVVQPFLDLSLVFLGLSLLFSRRDRNVFKTLGISTILVVSVLALREASLFVGTNGGAPVLGAWVPLMIFVPLSVRSCCGLLE